MSGRQDAPQCTQATRSLPRATDRGQPVALLVPTREDRWQELVVSGQVLAATGAGDLTDYAPGDDAIDASARLAAMRAEERWGSISARPRW